MDCWPTETEGIRLGLRQRGYSVVRDALSTDEMQRVRAAWQHHEEAGVHMSEEVLYTHEAPLVRGPGMRRIMDQWLNPHRRTPPLTTRPIARGLRGVVSTWLGQRAVLFQDVLMVKHERHAPFPWHQDFPFWPVDVPLGLVVWAPLEACDAESGGLHLAEGSHQAGIGPAVDLHTGLPQRGPAVAPFDPAACRVRCPSLEPGDVIIFDPLTWHASPVNGTGRPRRVWASTWLAETVRWSRARAPRHPLCGLIEDGAPVAQRLGAEG